MTIQKKLIYNSWHRGMREVDLILGPFAAIHVPDFSPLQLSQYETILDATDQDLLSWVYKKTPVPKEFNNPVMQKLIKFANRSDDIQEPVPQLDTTLKL